jgi:acetyl esterase/lipase
MKKLQFIFICSILVFNILTAQETIPLWNDNEIPNYQKSDGKEIIPQGNIVSIRNVQKPTLEVFLPSKQNANGMAVLICPGGGYGSVSYDWEGTDYAKWFNSQGIAAFVLKYRMPQAESVIISYDAPIQDAQRAIRYIRFNAIKFNVDKNKIGIIGSSAGGHLASTLGTHLSTNYYEPKDVIDNELTRPDFMMLIYPVISMKKGVTHMGSRNSLIGKNPSEELVLQFSNELQVSIDSPPTFIVHSGNDKAVPVENSIRIYQALVKNNVKTTMHIFPEGGHGYSLGKSKETAPDWTKLAATWFDSFNN